MALFDFFRRKPARPEGQPAPKGGVRGFFSRLFNRRKPAPAPEPEAARPSYYEEPEPEPFDLFEDLEDEYQPPAAEMPAMETVGAPAKDLSQVTTTNDRDLVERYSDMLDTMVERGYIDAFKSEGDAAEFLRVLSSQAWEEAHAYWYSVEALGQIQEAIERGATAGGLQEEYNRQVEKKSNHYLSTWDKWLRVEG